MTFLIYLSVFSAIIFPYTLIQALNKVIHKEDATLHSVITCLTSAVIVLTFLALQS